MLIFKFPNSVESRDMGHHGVGFCLCHDHSRRFAVSLKHLGLSDTLGK